MADLKPQLADFNWPDPFLLDTQLTEDDRMLRDAAAQFAQNELQPLIIDAYREATVNPGLFPKMGEAGLLGATIPEEYGGLGASYTAYGLIAREVERVDSGYRSMMSVQSSLVIYPIHAYGSEAQRQKFLPGLCSGALIGCFGLTEPDAGSDPAGMKTRIQDVDFQCADCGCLCGLGQIRRTWWKNPRVHTGKRYERVIGAKNWRQALPARLGHWGNRYGWCRGGRRRAFAECGRAQRTLWLSQPSPLWHCLGCYGRSRVLLARRIAIWSGQKAIQQASDWVR